MRQALREFGAVEGVKKSGDILPVTIARWIKAHAGRRAPATLDSLLRSFKAACAIGVASGYLKRDPFAVKIDVPDFDPDGEGKKRHHSAEEVGRVLTLARQEAAAGDWKAARLDVLVNLYAFAALRKNEALYLQREDIDFGGGILRIHGGKHRLKTSASAAVVPMATPLKAALQSWTARAGSAWLIPNIDRRNPWTGGPPGYKPLDQVKELGLRARVRGLTILSFRHSFATHARAWGLSELMLQAILRHTSRRTQKVYLHPDLPDLLGAIARVSYPVLPTV
jgi:integrase